MQHPHTEQDGEFIKSKVCLPLRSLWIHICFLWVSLALCPVSPHTTGDGSWGRVNQSTRLPITSECHGMRTPFWTEREAIGSRRTYSRSHFDPNKKQVQEERQTVHSEVDAAVLSCQLGQVQNYDTVKR